MVPVPCWYRYREFFIFLVVSEPVSKKVGIGKKSLNQYRKDLVPKKVPVLVSKIFSTGKKYRYRPTFWVPSHTDGNCGFCTGQQILNTDHLTREIVEIVRPMNLVKLVNKVKLVHLVKLVNLVKLVKKWSQKNRKVLLVDLVVWWSNWGNSSRSRWHRFVGLTKERPSPHVNHHQPGKDHNLNCCRINQGNTITSVNHH